MTADSDIFCKKIFLEIQRLSLLMIKVEFSTDDCLMIVSFVRFGFRQQHAKTAKVGDVSVAAEQAFGAPHKDKETAINNNALGELA